MVNLSLGAEFEMSTMFDDFKVFSMQWCMPQALAVLVKNQFQESSLLSIIRQGFFVFGKGSMLHFWHVRLGKSVCFSNG